MANIPALEAEVARCHAALNDAEHRLSQARIAAAGISIGDVVIGPEQKRYRVCKIDGRWARPWVTGHPQLKDGSGFGRVTRHLYDNWVSVPAGESQTRGPRP